MKITIFRKISRYATNFLMALLLAIGLVFAFSLLPIKDNYRLYSVMSGSMSPAIHVGSIVLVVPQKEYHVGEIITFISSGATSDKDTTTHRIISIAKDGDQNIYTTKGDANESPDAKPIAGSRIIGRYFGSVALVGYLLKYIVTLPGLISLVLIPAFAIILMECKKISQEVKNIKRRKNFAL